MGLAHSPRIVNDGLVLALDAGNAKSYPGSGTTWYDRIGNDNNGTLINGPIQETSIDFINPISINKLSSSEVKITASDGAAGDQFGYSVAVGSNKIVVGAYFDDDNGTSSGSVYVYDLDGTNQVKITASDGATVDLFGLAVAVGNNKIVVGAPDDDDNGSDSGSVYVYDLDGTNQVKITASDGAAGDKFGQAVAVGSNKIVVSAYLDDDNGSGSGSVYVYDLDGSNEVKITASDAAASDYFGYSVAVGNDKIVVGAYWDDDNGSASGSVYVYDLDGTNQVKITASDGAAYDYFGYSVAVGSNKIVVGAYWDDDNGSQSGSVYVYDLDGSNEVKITASDGADNDQFGISVAVGNDKIVVGAWADDDNGSGSGSAYVYDLDGSNEVKITASDGAASDTFGRSVAVGSNKIVVGAYGDDDNGSASGSVYVYTPPTVSSTYIKLDGTNDYITSYDDADVFVDDNSLTVSIFVNIDEPTRTDRGGLVTSQRYQSESDAGGYGLCIYTNGTICVNLTKNISGTQTSYQALCAFTYVRQQFKYYSFTYDNATKTIKTYMDGVEQATSTNANYGWTVNTTNRLTRIGRNTQGGWGNYYNMKIGAVHIHNRALSASEIQQNFNAIRGRFGI